MLAIYVMLPPQLEVLGIGHYLVYVVTSLLDFDSRHVGILHIDAASAFSYLSPIRQG